MAVRVLVVDDDDAMRMLLSVLLQRHGAVVVAEAACGEEAVRLFGRDLRPDLAIVDFNMPGIDGLECVRRLRAIEPRQRAVLFTASVAEGVRARASSEDVEVVPKTDLTGLLAHLRAAAARQRAE